MLRQSQTPGSIPVYIQSAGFIPYNGARIDSSVEDMLLEGPASCWRNLYFFTMPILSTFREGTTSVRNVGVAIVPL